MKTLSLCKIPRERSALVEGFRNTAEPATTSEPSVGNSRSGAPVIASMSDSASCNQGGTVEYICIPPLIVSGDGIIFMPFPQIRKEKSL